MGLKKAVDLKGASQPKKDAAEEGLHEQGVGHGRRSEAVPHKNKAPGETIVHQGENNTWICASTDMPAGLGSGYGAVGDTQAGQLDFVVGRMGYGPIDGMYVDNSFKTDACRIVMSQKTDIDRNFNLCNGTVGCPEAKSGIGIKADGVRIVGREGIKLVTTTDNILSNGERAESIGNIDLIAGNDDSRLEPLVKGYALARALEKIAVQLGDVTETLNAFLEYQLAFNASITIHTHPVITTPLGGAAGPSYEAAQAGARAALSTASRSAPSCVISMINGAGWRNNHLTPWGDDYILSENVNTT